MARTPDQILADYDAGCRGLADIDMREILHEVIDDIREAYVIAMGAISVSAPEQTAIRLEIDDYIANHWGDD